MNWLDWLLCLGVAAAFGTAFWLLLPPYGWIGGAVVAGLMCLRAKRKRDEMAGKSQHSEKKSE